jgi:plasmid maintenance system antidote protein VapI
MPNEPEMAREPNLRLKHARAKFFKSARAAATALGIPEATYYGYENGSRGIGPDVAVTLARRFNVTPEFLLYGRTKPTLTSVEINKSRNISLFLTSDLAYFNKIRSGLSPLSQKTMPMPDASLPARLYCVHQSDRSMVLDRAALSDRYPTIPQNVEVFIDPDAIFGPDDIVHAVIPRLNTSVIRLLTRYLDQGKVRDKLVAFNRAFEDIILDPKSDYIGGKYVGQIQLPGIRLAETSR